MTAYAVQPESSTKSAPNSLTARETDTAEALTKTFAKRSDRGTLIESFTVHGEHSTAMTGGGDADVAFPTETARCLDTTGGFATNQGGTIVRADDAPPLDVPLDPLPDSPRYAAMGDAVTVNVTEWIGLRLRVALEREGNS